MNLLVLRKLLILINLRLLVGQDAALIGIRRDVKKKIAQCKSGKNEDLQSFVDKVKSILSKSDVVKSEESTELESIDMSMFESVKGETNE